MIYILTERQTKVLQEHVLKEMMRGATVDAINSAEETYLFYGQDQFFFGLGDICDSCRMLPSVFSPLILTWLRSHGQMGA